MTQFACGRLQLMRKPGVNNQAARASRYRERAGELRSLAENSGDAIEREAMAVAAGEYQRLASPIGGDRCVDGKLDPTEAVRTQVPVEGAPTGSAPGPRVREPAAAGHPRASAGSYPRFTLSSRAAR